MVKPGYSREKCVTSEEVSGVPGRDREGSVQLERVGRSGKGTGKGREICGRAGKGQLRDWEGSEEVRKPGKGLEKCVTTEEVSGGPWKSWERVGRSTAQLEKGREICRRARGSEEAGGGQLEKGLETCVTTEEGSGDP